MYEHMKTAFHKTSFYFVKFRQGRVRATDNYDWQEIIVTAKAPNKVKEVLIGGGLIISGVSYLTYKAFRNGASAFDDAQTDALKKINVI